MSGIFKPEWLEGDKHPRVYAYYFRQWADYTMSFHTHASVEIMYVLSGKCRVEVARDYPCGDTCEAEAKAEAEAEAEAISGEAAGTDRKRSIAEEEPQVQWTGAFSRYELKKGQFIILDATVPHRLLVEEKGPCRMLNVEFDMAECATGLPSLRKLCQEDEEVRELAEEISTHLVLSDCDELYPVLKSLVLELGAGEESRKMKVQLLFAQLLVTIAHIRREMLAKGDNPAGRYVTEAIRYMQQNYDRDISVKDIASAVNLHPGYLHRVFGAATGTTITSYLTGLRMEKAMMLLRRTDIPVGDIPEYAGIGSRAYFHALFRKHTGVTPVEYRKSQQLHESFWEKEKS
jgi:AraC-like DNA-binding protein/mannose-6-phosphate isomerase-like protein (cupin superfamily)